MTKANQKKLNNFVKDFVTTISADELLCYNKDTGEIVVGRIPLDPNHVAQIKAEIEILKKGVFWKYLVKDVVFTQNHILTEKAQSQDDIIFHRAVKYTLKVLSEVIDAWDKQIK